MNGETNKTEKNNARSIGSSVIGVLAVGVLFFGLFFYVGLQKQNQNLNGQVADVAAGTTQPSPILPLAQSNTSDQLSGNLTRNVSTIPFQNNSVSILVVGDIMLDRNVRNLIGVNGFDSIFSGVKDLVAGADIAIGNLEGPFTTYPSKTATLVNKDLTFTFDPDLAPKLASLGFDVLGLANNHTLNFGKEGLDMTRDFVHKAGMNFYGDPNNKSQISTVIEKNGLKIGLVGYHEFSYVGLENILAEIDRLRPIVDVLIVSPHWGVEYESKPKDKIRQLAHTFIDHGADAVVGSHSHVIGEAETYKGKAIFYSLGNFLFDQYFSFATMNGLAVRITATKPAQLEGKIEGKTEGKTALQYDLFPIKTDKTGVSLADSSKAVDLVDKLVRKYLTVK